VVRSIMPMAFRTPPELTITVGVLTAGYGLVTGRGAYVLLGLAAVGLGVYDLWRAPHDRE
jgi:hypothetical protein